MTAPSFEDHLCLAHRACRAGDAIGAAQHFAAAAQHAPGNLDLRLDAGYSLLQCGDPAAAQAHLLAALALVPGEARALAGLGYVARQAGDRLTALGLFQEAVQADPTLAQEVAAELAALGRVAEAEEHYRTALARMPGNAAAHLGLAHVLRQKGAPDEATRHYQDAARLDPNNVNLLLDVGYSLLQTGFVDQAQAPFAAVLALAEGEPGALAGLGHVARHHGDGAAALRYFAAAAEGRPGDPQILIEVAAELAASGQIDEAQAQYRALIDLAPQDPRPHLGLAHMAQQRHDPGAALVHFEAAAARAPGHVDLRLDAGYSLLALDQLDAAAAQFAAVLAIAPHDLRAIGGLGHVARRRGDWAGARRHFQAAHDAAPGSIAPALELAAVLLELGEPAAAWPLTAEALANEPTHLRVLMLHGALARTLGDRTTALACFARAGAAHPTSLPAQLALAEEQRDQGQPSAAQATLQAVLAVEPGNLHALMQMADLAALAAAWEECHRIASQAMRLHPRDPAPYLQAARALMEAGRLDEALDALRTGTSQAGPAPFLAVRQAEILRRNGRWQDAHATLDGVRPGMPAAWTERIHLLIATGALDAAEQEAASFTAVSPYERALACHMLASIAEKRWQLHSAAALNRAALAFKADASFAHIALARILMLLLDVAGGLHHQSEASRLEASATLLRHGRPRASQTHVGQILDEFRIDPGLVAAMRPLWRLPPAERIGQLIDIVRAEPDAMAPAMQLMVALQQGQALDWRTRREPWPGPPVPRRIIQYWDEAEPPPGIAALMQGWRDAHPGYEYHRFDHRTATAFLIEHHGPIVLAAYRRAREPAQKSDIFRLAALLTLGGVYVDADDACLGSLDAVLPMQASLIGYLEHYGTFANNFLAAAPGETVIATALDLAVAAMQRGDEDIIWLSTGPGLLTRAFCRVLAAHPARLGWLARICMLDAADHSRTALFHAPAPYKATHRHWLRREFEQPRTPGSRRQA